MNKGKKLPEEQKRKMANAKLGKKNPFYGKHHTEQARQAISGAHRDDKNPQWKGDKVGIDALHEWVRLRLPKPEKCLICKIASPFDLANISGKYLRNLTDWQWLCRKCHLISDGRMNNLLSNEQKRNQWINTLYARTNQDR